MNEYEEDQMARVPASKRGVAFLCDVVLIFVASILITTVMHMIDLVVPLLTRYVSQVLVACLLLLIRDYFNSGRGFGKMFMGLEVVDYDTLDKPSLMQSIKRNIFLFAPVIAAELVQIILFVLPKGAWGSWITIALSVIGGIYVFVILPLEFVVYNKSEEGRRLGDIFANTIVIES
ncbi:MAG: RDD family protein [Cyanobacteria bacterium TGS_CYA1]|nr:RDD family protein [Cyanobacteria bacterium TGS_CYA1]MDX2107184.1 RDD family protein [Candidatus Melainabacteria bacterium]